MKTTADKVWAIRIRRKNGSSFFACAANSVIASWWHRKEALTYADKLAEGMAGRFSVKQQRRSISVVKVTIQVTVEK